MPFHSIPFHFSPFKKGWLKPNKLTSNLVCTITVFQTTIVVQLLSHVCLWPQGLQHTRLPCPSLFPRACSNLCPLNYCPFTYKLFIEILLQNGKSKPVFRTCLFPDGFGFLLNYKKKALSYCVYYGKSLRLNDFGFQQLQMTDCSFAFPSQLSLSLLKENHLDLSCLVQITSQCASYLSVQFIVDDLFT